MNALFSIIKYFLKRECSNVGGYQTEATIVIPISNSRNVQKDTFWPIELATISF